MLRMVLGRHGRSTGGEGESTANSGLDPGRSSLTERLPVQRRATSSTETTQASAGAAGASPLTAGDDPFALHLAPAVQRRADDRPGTADAVHAAAAEGTSGAGGSLPYLDVIQRSFGHHDVGGISAHTDDAAARGARAMGAEAFATGDRVAFAGTPSLHTAAHEAAHVVQQRAGVHLKGGVGEVGDAHERHADDVADRVVRGESAEALLDHYAPAGGAPGATPVQRKVGLEFETNVPVRDKDDKEVAYKTPVLEQTGWHIEADSSNLEFVTDPFDTWSGLSQAISRASGAATAIERRMAAEAPQRAALKGGWRVGNGTAMTVASAPQASGGVPLDKLPDLFATVASTKIDPTRGGPAEGQPRNSLMGMHAPDADTPAAGAWGATAAIEAIRTKRKGEGKEDPPGGFKKLEGVLGLIYLYIGKGEAQATVWSYAKLIAPIMARTSVSHMVAALDPEERACLTVDNVLAPLGIAPDAPMYAKGFKTKTGVSHGPTRRAWIEGLGRGVDMLSDESDTWEGSAAMGEMEMDTAKDGAPLAVLELRRLPKGATPAQWPMFAKAVYDFFATLDPSLNEKPVAPSPEGFDPTTTTTEKRSGDGSDPGTT